MNETILIKCPVCSNEFPLSDAVLSSVRDDLTRELQSEIDGREKRLSERQRLLEQKEATVAKREVEFSVPKAEIVAQDYDLSLTRYKEVLHEDVEHISPKQIIAELKTVEAEIQRGLAKLERMVG
jgi:hypothetical protein